MLTFNALKNKNKIKQLFYDENDKNTLIRNVKFNNWMTLIKSIEYKGIFDEIESLGTELILSVKYKVVN